MNEDIFRLLNSANREERLGALRKLAQMYESGALEPPARGENVNNHIHTIYSFSPYSPAKAVFMAWANGLATAGIMDHDSVAGTGEFIEAGQIINMPVTVGFECRCSVAGTPLEGKRLNNPDQKSVAYLAMHGIPHHMLGEAERFLAPYRAARGERNRAMVGKLNKKLAPYGLALDYDRDILPISQYSSGGSVTERHIVYALAAALTDKEMPRYFLLGMFKSQLLESFYVDAEGELPHISDFISLSEKLCAVPAYAYLGDVGVSVTGDKKAQAFEDSYLDELLAYLVKIGMRAVTYMPARNSSEQLSRIRELCKAYNLLEISGEDINSPLQGFICEKIETPEFRHLIDSAWALIGHENATALSLSQGMFSPDAIASMPQVGERVKHYADLARCQFDNKTM